MKEYFTFEEIDLAAQAVQKRLHYKPRVGLILGSGLGDMANTIESPDIIPFKDIPNWPEATAPGHVGRLVWENWKIRKSWCFRDACITMKAILWQR
jgi:purine-nucleoside phosphorylase